MNETEYKALVEKIGKEAADKIAQQGTELKSQFETMIEASKAGTLTEEKFKEYQTAAETTVKELKDIAEKQGTTIQEMLAKINTQEVGHKTIAEQLKSDVDELREIYKNKSGSKEYMVSINEKGTFTMVPFDTVKAAGPHATMDAVGGGGNTGSVTQAFDATTILRMGSDAPIISQFRNVPFIFSLCNLINVGFDTPFFMWIDEQAKQGASAAVLEGGTKPNVQYAYELKSEKYKKEAMLLSFTEEFSLDFARLQDDIVAKGRLDLLNRINTAVLTRMKAAATAYNSAATYTANGTDLVLNVNDYDAIAAMASQVENSTFTTLANTALMNTAKKYRLGTLKDNDLRWLNSPEVLNNISFVSNPALDPTDIIVGDLKQYNIALRGGMIVRIGYNGTDFAENRFSQVIEQYYFDYISEIRKAAIVKGPDFATVKAAIS